jgi:hypothetical protein
VAYVIPDNHCLIGFDGKLGSGEKFKMQWGALLDGVLDFSDLTSWQDDVIDIWNGLLSTTTEFRHFFVYQTFSGTTTKLENDSDELGEVSAALSPPQVQALLLKRSPTIGKGGRGFTFIPDIQESTVNNNGTLTSGIIAAYQTAADSMQDLFQAALSPFNNQVILHTEEGANAGEDPAIVTGYSCSARVATLRGRYSRAIA